MSVPCGKKTPNGPCQRRVSQPNEDCGVDHVVVDLLARKAKVVDLAAQAALLDEDPSVGAFYDEAIGPEIAEAYVQGKTLPELAHLAAYDPDADVRRAASAALMKGNGPGTARLLTAIFADPEAA